MSEEDITNVGLTENTHIMLKKLKINRIFNEMHDGYRFGIALAIARGLTAPENLKIETFLSVSTLDKDGMLRNLITELYPEARERPYAMAQRLAEAGLTEIGQLYENDELHFSEIYSSVLIETQEIE
jgi:hypothetical protein